MSREPRSIVGAQSQPPSQPELNRRQFLIRSSWALGGLVVAACTPQTLNGNGTEAGPANGNGAVTTPTRTLIVGLEGEPPTLFQNLEYQPHGYSIYDGIMQYLVKADPRDPRAGQQPQLAVEWEPVAERQWEFRLREGVQFHNGEPWNAEAAKFNLDKVFEIDPPSPVLFRIEPFESAEVRDEFTLIVNTKEPWAMCPIGLSEVQFAAPAALDDLGAEAFAQNPIGTGPYQMAEWREGEAITVERYGGYWGSAPTVELVEFRGIPDVATRLAALQAGEVHIAEQIEIEDLPALEGEGFVIADTPEARSNVLSPYIAAADDDGDPTANALVRLAMNHAINRQEIIDTVLGGFGQLMNGQVVGPDAFGHNPNIEEYAYDPQRARQLLAEAGFPDGVDLGPMYAGEPSAALKQRDFMEVIRSQLAEVGIEMQVEIMEQSTFLRRALQDYDLNYWQVGGWQYYPVMDAAFAYMWYDTDAFLQMDLNDPEYDEVFRASNQEFDVERRRELLHECSRILHEKPGPVPLWQNHKTYVHSPNIEGFTPTPDNRIHLDGIQIT